MGTLVGAVLRKEWGLVVLLGAPALAHASDDQEIPVDEGAQEVVPGRALDAPGALVQRMAGGKTWQLCGPLSAPCTGERGVVWSLASAQVLSEEHQEVKELRLVVSQQGTAIGLLEQRLELAQEYAARAEGDLLGANDALQLSSEDNRTLLEEGQRLTDANQKLTKTVQKLRLRWFCFGALTVLVPVIVGAAIAGFAL